MTGCGTEADPYSATFELSGSDVYTTQTWTECGNGSEDIDYSGPATIHPDGTIEAHGSIGDGTGDFIGSVNEAMDQVTGTLTLNNPGFDSPIVGPLTLTRQ